VAVARPHRRLVGRHRHYQRGWQPERQRHWQRGWRPERQRHWQRCLVGAPPPLNHGGGGGGAAAPPSGRGCLSRSA